MQRVHLLSTVTVDPQMTALVTDAARFQTNGWDNYGIPGHAIYWGPSVNAKSIAIMGDCMDFSHVGRIDAKTKEKLTIGRTNQNFRGVFAKISSSEWRVSNIEFLKGAPC